MIYLIEQLAVWLLLTAAFAALAGWAFAAERAAPAQAALRQNREKLVHDLAQLATGGAPAPTPAAGTADPAQSLTAIREGRITELERALDQARSRADAAAGELADLQRRDTGNQVAAAELARLRTQVDAHEAQAAATIEAHAEPAQDDNAALQTWRLRYFEQRVRFLETRAITAVPPQDAPAPVEAAPLPVEWRAREAEARAIFLEQELRAHVTAPAEASPPESQDSPFAANADVDALLRWRLLYLERRVAHLQSTASPEATAALAAVGQPVVEQPDPDRWRWRARYLESRVRHLEQRGVSAPPAAPAVLAAAAPLAEPPTAAPIPRERPPGLQAPESGAPDDFRLIDGVSALQQSTLYSLGIYHFDQIAAWTAANVAWVDNYLRLRGRITEEEWVEQAADLAREGPDAARQMMEDESV